MIVTWSDGIPHFFGEEYADSQVIGNEEIQSIAPPPWDASAGKEMLGSGFDSLASASVIIEQGRMKDVIEAYEQSAKSSGMTSDAAVVRDLYAWTMRWKEAADIWPRMNESERLSLRQIHRQMVLSYLIGDDDGFQKTRGLALADVERIGDAGDAWHILKGVTMKPLAEKDFAAVEKLIDLTASTFDAHPAGAETIWLAAYRLGKFNATWGPPNPRPVESRTHRETLARCLLKHRQDADFSSAIELAEAMFRVKADADRLADSGYAGPYWWDYGESKAILGAVVELLRDTGFVNEAKRRLVALEQSHRE